MRRTLWAVSCLALVASHHASAQQFTYNAAALPANSAFTDGVELADVDGDGDIDILFANRGGSGTGAYGAGIAVAQHLFLNNGSGIFSAGHAQLNVANMATGMVIAEDFDNDGDKDIMYARDGGWPSPTLPPVILINNGAGIFSDQTASRIPAGFNMSGFCVCAGDVDNDGDLDVVVTNGGTFAGAATQARLLVNNGAGVFTDGTAAKLPVDLYTAQDVTLADADNDLDIDILLDGKGGAGKQARLYLNGGAGTFTISPALNAVGTSGTYEVEYGDLDGDNDFDAFVQSIASFNEGWAQNNGTATAWTKTTVAGPNQDDNEMCLMDFDNDGDLDAMIGSLSSSERAYTNNGLGGFTLTNGIFQVVNDSSLDMGFADLNGDGKYDAVTAQGEGGTLDRVYMNSGSADTLAPTFEVVETPAAIGATETVFRARIADAISDDGHISAHLSYAWVTTGLGAGSGSGQGRPQGGGQFRASVPTTVGTTSVSLTWTATDDAGNVSNNGPILVSAPDPWTNLGGGLAGVNGIPVLIGAGPLTTGSPGTLVLSSAAPASLGSMFVSLANSPSPFKCGVLVTVPVLFQLILNTNGAGNVPLAWPSWPSGLSGASVYFQWAIADGAAVCGVSISNAVRGDVP